MIYNETIVNSCAFRGALRFGNATVAVLWHDYRPNVSNCTLRWATLNRQPTSVTAWQTGHVAATATACLMVLCAEPSRCSNLSAPEADAKLLRSQTGKAIGKNARGSPSRASPDGLRSTLATALRPAIQSTLLRTSSNVRALGPARTTAAVMTTTTTTINTASPTTTYRSVMCADFVQFLECFNIILGVLGALPLDPSRGLSRCALWSSFTFSRLDHCQFRTWAVDWDNVVTA